jgi:hypothetical protein
MRKTLNGTVIFDAGTNTWMILDQVGGLWRPVNLPEHARKDNLPVRVSFIHLPEQAHGKEGNASTSVGIPVTLLQVMVP